MEPRNELLDQLESYYRDGGWKTRRAGDIVIAAGPGGVDWIGRGVATEDMAGDGLEDRLRELADRRMPATGELCPLELLPAPECAEELDELLTRTGLGRSGHVVVYSLAA